MNVVVKIIGAASTMKTPHDERYVVNWNPHTRFGISDVQTTDDKAKARRFKDAGEVMTQWRTTSNKQQIRPTDGKANRPLTAYTIEILPAEQPETVDGR